MKPVTIAICTYNNADLLAKVLTCLEQQSANSDCWSVLVVDNNSTDDTRAVVGRYIERGRIPGLRHMVETEQGVAYGRRRAILEADSKWIAFIDDDCLLGPEWLAEALDFCNAHPHAGVIGGRVDLAWEVSPDELFARHASGYAHQDYGPAVCQVPANGHLVGPGLIVRKRAVIDSRWPEHMILVSRKAGKLTTGDDSEIVFRIRNAGYELWYDPALVVQHCIPQHRMSVQHLCRLYRGCGQARPFADAMKANRRPTVGYRVRVCARNAKRLATFVRSLLMDHLLAGREMSPDQRIGLSRRIGELEGGFQFLLKGYKT